MENKLPRIKTPLPGPGAQASTFGGNPVACAAALETIRLLEEKYIANAVRMGEYILGRLTEANSRNSAIQDSGFALRKRTGLANPEPL